MNQKTQQTNLKKRSQNQSSSSISKRPKKKRKIEVEVDLDPTSENYKVTLSRDELLNLSSKQFEAYVKQLEGNKTLSDEEKKELKRQRRLIKNRESAQASRQRKKSYIDELEKKVMNLTNENSNLYDKVSTLTKENDQLKTEVLYLQNVISKSGFVDVLSSGVQKVKSLKNDVKNTLTTSGIAFCILLFTFGILFNFNLDSNPFIESFSDNIPELLPGRLFTEENEGFKLTSNDKQFFDFFSPISDYSNKRLEEQYKKKKAFDMKEKIITLQSNEHISSKSLPVENEELNKNKNPTVYAVTLPSSNTTYLICDYNSTLSQFQGLPNNNLEIKPFPAPTNNQNQKTRGRNKISRRKKRNIYSRCK